MSKVPKSNCKLLLLLALSIILLGVPQSIEAKLDAKNHDVKHHFPTEKQGKFASRLSTYDVVTPVKVTDSGHFISHDLFHDSERFSGESGRTKREIEHTVHYDITLDGKSHRIRLYPNNVFLAPHAVVERRNKFGDSKNKIGNTTSQVTPIGTSVTRCHFVGKIDNHTSSKVALSACDGLQGFLRTNDNEYLIEPIKGQLRSSGEPHPHLIYRKSALPVPQDEQTSSCSSTENSQKAFEERARWEKATNPQTDPRRSSRRKRSVSVERNVEVLVVTDKQMIDYYSNEDLNTYILTVMNMVSSIYHDASIGNAVNIIVVRIMLLETPQYEEELSISHDADETLMSFCKWQQMVNPTSETHPHHHDVAVLITRYNICSKSNDHCSTLGLAEIAGMCQPLRSCNVNEDTGLQIAYTIAHEIGHNFGMNHDGPTNGCKSLFGHHVMSPHLASDSIPITWSNCSRNEITTFLDREWGSCLEDEPQKVEYNFPELPPGAMYDASHQCRLNFGAGATHCDGMEVECETLWCRINNRCVTRLDPSAEGTQCGKHKWCYHGKCVPMGERPAAIHGNWGSWSEWSRCSRRCGAGVEVATRHCNNPLPANGGRYCTGERRKYRICNTHECPIDQESFRAAQCSHFDHIPYKGQNYTWQPVTLENKPCQLNCKPDNEFYSVELKDSVVDGTPCTPGARDMCIHGICKRVTCDWTIEGSAQEDRCGICHGDGTQCVTTKGQFNVTQGVSYVSIVTFPEGVRNLRIEEIADAANYLAIRDYETGQYHLNGNWIIQWSGEYSAYGVMMYYKRVNETETLFLPGPLKRSLTLLLLFQTKNPGIIWEYTIPHENATYTPEFSWQLSDWSICSQTCGGGTQTSKVQCHEKEAGLVEDKYCNGTRPEDDIRECNTHACPAWWWSGPWQPCSVTCGDNGVRRRTVICVRSYGPTEQMALMDSNCPVNDKPKEEESCPHLSKCPTDKSWEIEPWIESCRGDPCEFETRIVKCVSLSGFCDTKYRPHNLRQCGDITCGRWEVGSWDKCSTSCGDGVQIRRVECVGGSACIRIDEPASVKECNIGECSMSNVSLSYIPAMNHSGFNTSIYPNNSSLNTDIVGSTSVDSLNPRHNNTSFEEIHINKINSIVDFNKDLIEENNVIATTDSDSSTNNENHETPANSNPSPDVVIEKESAISNLLLDYIVPDDYYDDIDVVTSTTPKDDITIKVENKITKVDDGTTEVEDVATKADDTTSKHGSEEGITAPELEETSYTKLETPIPLDKTQIMYEIKDITIESGELDHKNNNESVKANAAKLDINNSTKPSQYIVSEHDYDYYNEDDYDYNDDDDYEYLDEKMSSSNETEILRPTGIIKDTLDIEDVQVIEAVRKRGKNHKGKSTNFKKVKIHTGKKAIKVLEKFSKKANRKKYRNRTPIPDFNGESSSMTPEFKWTVGSWSKCSDPCGGGTKLRPVECYASLTDSIVQPWKCHSLPPPDLQPCNMVKCLEWNIGEFGDCSEKCGEGVKKRNATCPEEGRCHDKNLPSLQEKCQQQSCVKWVEGPWSMCTKSCGEGYQIRYVKCVDVRTQEASDECTEDKPPHKKSCNNTKCQQNRQSQQSHCKDHLDEKLCRRLLHMCTTKFFRVKCCRTCHLRKRG